MGFENIIKSLINFYINKNYVYSHPFIDGNGRTTRLLLNLLLMINGYAISVIKTENRDIYMKALEKASTQSDISEFVNIVSEAVDRILDTYLYIVV